MIASSITVSHNNSRSNNRRSRRRWLSRRHRGRRCIASALSRYLMRNAKPMTNGCSGIVITRPWVAPSAYNCVELIADHLQPVLRRVAALENHPDVVETLLVGNRDHPARLHPHGVGLIVKTPIAHVVESFGGEMVQRVRAFVAAARTEPAARRLAAGGRRSCRGFAESPRALLRRDTESCGYCWSRRGRATPNFVCSLLR